MVSMVFFFHSPKFFSGTSVYIFDSGDDDLSYWFIEQSTPKEHESAAKECISIHERTHGYLLWRHEGLHMRTLQTLKQTTLPTQPIFVTFFIFYSELELRSCARGIDLYTLHRPNTSEHKKEIEKERKWCIYSLLVFRFGSECHTSLKNSRRISALMAD